MGPSLWILHLTRFRFSLLADCSENCSDSGGFLPLHGGHGVENVLLVGMDIAHGGLNAAVSRVLLQGSYVLSVAAGSAVDCRC